MPQRHAQQAQDRLHQNSDAEVYLGHPMLPVVYRRACVRACAVGLGWGMGVWLWYLRYAHRGYDEHGDAELDLLAVDALDARRRRDQCRDLLKGKWGVLIGK